MLGGIMDDAVTTPAALKERDIHCLNHLRRVLPLLDQLNEVGCERDTAGNRCLFFGDYSKLVLLYIWNPLIESLRQLQQATELRNVQQVLGVKRFSLGSFSEAPRVFEPERLEPIIAELAGQLPDTLCRIDPRLAELKQALTLVDGTIVAALGRLAKAAVGESQARYAVARDGTARYAWRLHVQLELESFCPVRLDRTGGSNAGPIRENNVLRSHLEAGRCYVGDGGFFDRSLLNDIDQAKSSYVMRASEDTVFEVAQERLLTREDLDAGVVRDVVLSRLGQEWAKPPMNHTVRLVEVQIEPQRRRTRKTRAGVLKGSRYSDVLLIVTNLLDLPAELVALIYLYRYTVELFFRVLKQLLGMKHLLSQRPNGIDVQINCTLIVCLLLCLMTGHRPDKTTRNMIGWYLSGLASEEELLTFLRREDRTGVKLKAKDELWKKLGY